jgi:hypothetical protein
MMSPLSRIACSNVGLNQPEFDEIQLNPEIPNGVTLGESGGSAHSQLGGAFSGRNEGSLDMQDLEENGAYLNTLHGGVALAENGRVTLEENDMSRNLLPQQTNVMQTSTVGPGTGIEAECAKFGITTAMIQAARCNDKDKSLLKMVLNHRAMVDILVLLGYHKPNIPPRKKTAVEFSNGMKFSTENFLRSFDWTFQSYKHKVQWYSWAANIANNSEWNESARE